MKIEKETIAKIVKDFINKYLRMSVSEQDKLELDLGYKYKWKIKDKKQQIEVQKQQAQTIYNSITDRQNSQYFNVAMLFFSEIATENALDIQMLDTLYFQPDHTIYYVYKDSRKGLLKMRLRGISACQSFLKRKSRKRNVNNSKERMMKRYKSTQTLTNQERSQKSIKQELGYIALLKYKDGTFLRLKESDLRSIFTNPIYANEKFRHHNATQYIQALPQQGTDEFRIHFSWQNFKQDYLLKLATNYQLGICQHGDRATFRKQLAELDPLVYIYFTVFQICGWIRIHYNKRIESATFHFVKDGEQWSLAGIQSAKIKILQQKEFIKANLWEQNKKVAFQSKEDQKQIFKLKEQAKSGFYKKVQACFQETNNNIKTNMLDFVQAKLCAFKRNSDKLLSKNIFHILHPQKKKINLYDLLDSPQHLSQFIKKQNNSQIKKMIVCTKSSKEKREKEIASKKRSLMKQYELKRQNLNQYVYRGIQSNNNDYSQFLQ